MITIDRIEESDLTALGELYEQLSGKPTNMKNLLLTYKKLREDNNYYLLGARENGKLVGTLMGIICYDLSINCQPFLVVENVVVKKEARERGIGKKLMEYMEKEAVLKDCYYSMLLSASKRLEAHIFYEKNGYKRDIAFGFKKIF